MTFLLLYVCVSLDSSEDGILFLFKFASLVFQFTAQVVEKQMNYRTQLQHSHSSQGYLQSSTNFKVQYNNLMPFLAGLQWKDVSRNGLKKWEGEVPQTISSLLRKACMQCCSWDFMR